MDDVVDEKDMPNYKIFWVDDDYNKNIVLKFNAKNDEEAYAKLLEYCKQPDDHTYYYGHIHYCKCVHSDGKTTSIRCLEKGSIWPFKEKKCFVARVFEGMKDFIAYWLYYKHIDIWYKIKDIAYLLEHHEAQSNQWNLDQHLVDSIELNVPSLIKYSHGMMFLDEAILRLHGNDEGFDLKKYHESHYRGYPKEVEDLAMKIQQEEYSKLLLYVKQYKYYSNFGIVDPKNPDDVAFDKEWRHTLPVKKGTYDEFDYDMLKTMYDKAWDNIWDWVKEYGHTLYD